MRAEINYCQRCGSRMIEKTVEGKARSACKNCGFFAFQDPKIAVAVIVAVALLALFGVVVALIVIW